MPTVVSASHPAQSKNQAPVSTTAAPSRQPGRSRAARRWSWPRFTRNAAVIAAAAGLGAWFIAAGVVPNVVPKRFGTVVEGAVYRSGELTPAALARVVRDHRIRTIVDLGAFDHDPAGERREQMTAEALGARRVVLPLNGDATGDPNRYVEALRLLRDPAAHPVLIHCSAGTQRTGCAVALYRMIEQGWTRERAMAEAARYDHDPADNPRLTETLDRWQDDIRRALDADDPIPYPPPGAPAE